MEQQITKQATDFMLNLTGQEGTVVECLPEPTGWLVRMEVREAEEETEEGRVAWLASYDLHLDPLLAVVGCQRRAARREPLPGGATPVVERQDPPEPVPAAEPTPAVEPAPEPPAVDEALPKPEPTPVPAPPVAAGPRPRAPEPLTRAPETQRVSIVYRADAGGEG